MKTTVEFNGKAAPARPEKMSLSTLLEAARFLELQEQQQQQQQQHRITLDAVLTTSSLKQPLVAAVPARSNKCEVVVPTQQIQQQPQQQQAVVTTQTQQAVVITSTPTLLQGPITFTTAPNPVTPVVKKIEQDGQISSTTPSTGAGQLQQPQRPRVLHNSFDIMNPLIIDESPNDQKKVRQAPMVFRAGTREIHNKLEKHRRAHLKECYDILKKQLPSNGDEKKTSNLSILHSALRYIHSLKRKERELEHEMERLAREKISAQQKLAILKKEISSHYDNVDFSKLLPEVVPITTTTIVSSTDIVTSGSTSVSSLSSSTCSSSSDANTSSSSVDIKMDDSKLDLTLSPAITTNGDKVAIPALPKNTLSLVNQTVPVTQIKEVSQPVQTTALSVLPMSYPVNQGLVLQKVAIVPHNGLKDLTPLVSTHFITTPQPLNGINGQINGKVVPLAQYLVKPVVVVSTASPRSSS